jgi:Cna protein B-type domain
VAGVMITAMSSDIWLSLTSMPVIPLTPELSMAPRSPILIKHWK